jgi:hypothetical protein
MSGQISRPLGSIALVATLLMSGVGVTVPARADECLAAPNSPAPQGSHWYYRLDWATQRKCWYVRAPGLPAQQAATSATLARVTPLHSMPAASGSKSAQAITSTTDKLVQRSENEGNTAPSVLEAPAPQASTSSQTSPEAPAAPEAWPDAAPAVAALNAPAPIAVPTDAPADVVSVDAERTAQGHKPTENAGMPMIVFPILALGLTLVGALFMKIAAMRRARIPMDRPEPDSNAAQYQHARRDDQDERGIDERREYQSLISAVSEPFRVDSAADLITHEISKRKDKLAQLHQDLDRLLQSSTAV